MVTETRSLTLSRLISAYLASRRHLSPSTQRYYRTCLHNFEWYAKESGWPADAAEITRDHLRQFLDYVRTRRHRWGLTDPTRSSARASSSATLNHYGRVIKRLFRWAADEEGYPLDGSLGRMKLPPAHYRQVEPYTDGEVLAMLDACDQEYQTESRFLGARNRAIIAIFCDTGMRLSELAGIKLADLHSSLGQVRVSGKGHKTRVLPLQGESMKALNRYLLHRSDGSEWLWLSDDGRPLQAASITTMVARLKRKAGVSAEGLVHRFRHYFATRYLDNGGNPSALRLLLGHESFAMVLHYTRMVDSRRAVSQHADFSPLDHLVQQGSHSRGDGWGWHR